MTCGAEHADERERDGSTPCHPDSCRAERTQGDLAEISAAVLAMSRHLDVGQVLQTIVGSARRLLGARYAALGVPDDHGGFAQFVVDGVEEEQWRAIGPLPRQHGVLASMVREGCGQHLADVRDHPDFAGWPKAHPELVDFLGVPILDGDEILGALFLANKDEDRPESDHPADRPDTTERAADPGGRGFDDRDDQLMRILAAHAAIALSNARLYERSRELTVADERARIAQELHDAVAQKLFSLRLTAQAAATLVDTRPERAREELDEVAELAKQAADEMRAVVVELRPAALAEDGLLATLRSEVDVLHRAHEAHVTFHADRVRALPVAQEETVLRVAQEALHNALRHGQARRVSVSLHSHEERGARLRVADDGQGFDVDAVRGQGRRLGLVSMRERAVAVSGTVRVDSTPGQGTVVELEVPGG